MSFGPKKPKGFKVGSIKGRRNQLFSDKIKEAKEKGFSWLNVKRPNATNIELPNGDFIRIKIEITTDENIPKYGEGYRLALIKSKKGIELTEISDYKGSYIMCSNNMRVLQTYHILAIVTEIQARL